jgi:propionyl-CoA carboxylase beta chain
VTAKDKNIDPFTTAGKIADLKKRYHEAVLASGEAAIE